MPEMTPREFAAYCRRMGRDLRRNIVRAERENVRAAARSARKWSSGRVSMKVLRKLRPYAKRHPKPLRDPGRINIRKGIFRSHWKEEPPEQHGDELQSGIHNTAPQGPFLEQEDPPPTKSTMWKRPLADRVAAEIEAGIEERRERAIEDTLQP